MSEPAVMPAFAVVAALAVIGVMFAVELSRVERQATEAVQLPAATPVTVIRVVQDEEFELVEGYWIARSLLDLDGALPDEVVVGPTLAELVTRESELVVLAELGGEVVVPLAGEVVLFRFATDG